MHQRAPPLQAIITLDVSIKSTCACMIDVIWTRWSRACLTCAELSASWATAASSYSASNRCRSSSGINCVLAPAHAQQGAQLALRHQRSAMPQ